ncbi:excalibur calcium-binding domain-containing protein [Enemella evansiae]|uniref:Excalibur calcium-binding domain-containing protein n=1 Tax=Enemella evansiae TaxID=2016499 RepID=A0A255GF97_9ACTN|nr:excalibur calcium-binding domain-containing protein [Enemella evansiae]PFG67688.1 excalibur calcium-binding domain-containing protein [Propionibacteriaceae bacterium ES.041]OYN94624.1 hypothetical protein CGZ96_17255 [Enemella evansiae]OYO01126.1 hypothetical protein CGZ97_16880 [Enemella evansiae]OYO14519.1 hypothetical protein CGZ94_07970 [Enemella evansiae]TDO93558.1 excalibur calcium-binding domain-containing protein [Enemella evansiae]
MKNRTIAAFAAAALIGSGLLIPTTVAQAAPPKSCSDTMRRDIPVGDPDYAPRLDRDRDGVACETADFGPGGESTAKPTKSPTKSSTAKPTRSSSTSTGSKASSGGLAKTGV